MRTDQFPAIYNWHGIARDQGPTLRIMVTTAFLAAWRHINKNRTAVILNVSGLAIGIATCLLISIWAERELTFDNFHPEANAKFRVWNTFTSEAETFSQAPSGNALGAQLPKIIPGIASACRVFNSSYKVKYDTEVHFESDAIVADSNFFSFFGFTIIKGTSANILTDPDKVVLTRSTAIRYFGNVEQAIDKTVLVDDSPMTVAAVAENPPSNSHIQFDLVLPYSALHAFALRTWKQDIDNVWVGGWPHTYLQLHDPVNWKDVEGDVNRVVAENSKKEWADNKMSYQYFLQPIRQIHLHSDLRYDSANNGSIMTVRVFIAVAILVLLLACFNYINLTTATSIRRAREISLRKVAGASRTQLLRQFLSETFVITMVSVLIGIALAQMTLPYFSSWMAQPYELSWNVPHVIALGGFILAITLVSGFYPSMVLSSFQPIAALRGKFVNSESGQTFRKALVVVQFTISTILLFSILTVNRQMRLINSQPLGYDNEGVITIDFNGEHAVVRNYEAMKNGLLSGSSIESTSLHSGNVVGGLGNGWIATHDLGGKEVTTSIYAMNVDPDYFSTYKMKVIAGRPFMRGTSDSSKAVLVNMAAVKNLGWESPDQAIGKPFGRGDEARYVIGVVENFHFENLHAAVQPLLIGYANNGSSLSLRVSTGHIKDAINHLQAVWTQFAPEVPLHYSFVDEFLEQQYAREQKMETIFYVFAGLSFLIACLGLFGLSTFMASQRLQEISIRKVLGSSVAGIVVLLTKDFSKLVFVSVMLALPIGWLLMKEWLSTFIYQTEVGWEIVLIAFVVPLLIATVTTGAQAIRASLINAAKMLRAE